MTARRTPTSFIALFGLLLLALVACETSIRVDSIEETATRVVERHNRYVQRDADLTEARQEAFVDSANQLLETLEAARDRDPEGHVRAQAIENTVEAVTERHDDYVEGDDSVPDRIKQVYLRSSQLLRETVAASGRPATRPGE